MSRNRALLVLYDTGSLAPTRLREAARQNACDLVFVVAGTEHAQEMIPALQMAGSVVNTVGRRRGEILRMLRDVKPAGIVTFSEFQIAATVRVAEALGLSYHPCDDLEAITRKDRQRRRFAEAGIDSIRFRAVTSLDQVEDAITYVGLPLIIKPVLGASSRNTVAASTSEECYAAVAAVLAECEHDGPTESEVLLEELLVGRPTDSPWGDYIAVDCVANGDDVRPVFVTSKFDLAKPFRERGGYGAHSVVPESEVRAARSLACRAVRALNIYGIADVEIKLTVGGPRVIEVNGRLGGWVDDLAVRSHTADPADIAIKAALGDEYETPEAGEGRPIAFHYLVVPPMWARRVKAFDNLSRLRRLRNVDRVSALALPGTTVGWRHGARANVAAVIGATQSHEELAETIAAINDVDAISYE